MAGSCRGSSPLLLTLLLIGAVVTSCGNGSQRSGVDPNLSAHLRQARTFGGFPLYWAGMRLGDLPLTGVSHAPEHFGEEITFLYGTCVESGEEGTCSLPMEIQVTDLCNRLPRDLGVHLTGRLRGALTSPAEGGADNGGALSLYVQGATITIYGRTRKLDREAVTALRGANSLTHTAVGQPLPAASRKQVAGSGC